MRLLILAFLLVHTAPAAKFVAGASGNWNNPATWGSPQIPGNHDTVLIKDGVTVTVSDARIIGTSESNGAVALALGRTGALIVASGGTLQVRGDIQWSAGEEKNPAPYLTIQAGGVLEFDSSQAARPTATKYKAQSDGPNGFRPFVTTGTSKSHAIVRSNPAGGNGYFALRGAGGSYSFAYTDFRRIGDASRPAFVVESPGGAATPTRWVAIHNTFTSCGLTPLARGSMNPVDVFKHDYNVHSGSLGSSIFSRGGKSPAIAAGGVREIVGNVFDILADSGLDGMSFTIHSNYFADGLVLANSDTAAWAMFQNNFFIHRASRRGPAIVALGNVLDNFWFVDQPAPEMPKVIGLGAAAALSVSGNLLECSGDPAAGTGEFVFAGGPLFHGNYPIINNILLPATTDHACTTLLSIQDPLGNSTTFSAEHNVYYGEWDTTIPAASRDAVHVGEGIQPGTLLSYRNNILWNQTDGASYKLGAAATAVPDSCAPANCDFNDGLNTKDGEGVNKGGGNGYAAPFSSLPGAHDVSLDPMFFDTTRSLETFDTAYLGNSAKPWNSAGKYRVGDVVSCSDAAIRGGVPINYRYVNQAGCSNANPQPGKFDKISRTCWEWASLYRLRQGVAVQKLYEDNNIGVYGNDIITVLIQWIRTGFSPSNAALAQTGSDGKDIGAVPVTLPALTFETGAAPGNPPSKIPLK